LLSPNPELTLLIGVVLSYIFIGDAMIFGSLSYYSNYFPG